MARTRSICTVSTERTQRNGRVDIYAAQIGAVGSRENTRRTKTCPHGHSSPYHGTRRMNTEHSAAGAHSTALRLSGHSAIVLCATLGGATHRRKNFSAQMRTPGLCPMSGSRDIDRERARSSHIHEARSPLEPRLIHSNELVSCHRLLPISQSICDVWARPCSLHTRLIFAVVYVEGGNLSM